MNVYKNIVKNLLTNKPYLGIALHSFQGLRKRHDVLMRICEELISLRAQDKFFEILEIGSYAGGSTLTIGHAFKKKGVDFRITCVDPWFYEFPETENSLVSEIMESALNDSLIENLFDHNVKTSGLSNNVRKIKGTVDDLEGLVNSSSIDLVFIDGSHIYEDVLKDILKAKEFINDSGLICGDDLELKYDELEDIETHSMHLKNKIDFALLSNSTYGYHPGVTQAVHDSVSNFINLYGIWICKENERLICELNLDDITEYKIPHLEQIQNELIEIGRVRNYKNYNIIKIEDSFVAVRSDAGKIDFYESFLKIAEQTKKMHISDDIDKIIKNIDVENE